MHILSARKKEREKQTTHRATDNVRGEGIYERERERDKEHTIKCAYNLN